MMCLDGFRVCIGLENKSSKARQNGLFRHSRGSFRRRNTDIGQFANTGRLNMRGKAGKESYVLTGQLQRQPVKMILGRARVQGADERTDEA
ncbi:hypothetical protein HDU82_007203, partial [Entophlyctis luteolus]